jgi:hypothetical protein
MAHVRLPYIAWRDGRPRFQPGPRERALGFKNADLKHPDGAWFTLDEARGFAEARAAEIRQQRLSGRRLKRPPTSPGRTVEDLLEAFLASGKFKRSRAEEGYADKTKDDYRKKADVLIWKPRARTASSSEVRDAVRQKEEFAATPARDLKAGAISNDEDGGFFRVLRKERGLSTARGAIMVLSAAYKWARKAAGWQIEHNPCTRLGLKKPKPNPVTFTIAEFNVIVAYADHPLIDEVDVADAAFVALYSGQRPSDIRAYDGGGTSEGVTRLVQSKRGKRVAILQLPPLVARLEQMRLRREASGWTCAELVVDHHTGNGFKESTLQHRFLALRKMIAAGRPDLGLAPMPSLAKKQMKHFRSTLGTWMKNAEVPDNQFAAVTGHSLQSLPQVMPHYYDPGEADAAAAMNTLWAWMQKQGMTG